MSAAVSLSSVLASLDFISYSFIFGTDEGITAVFIPFSNFIGSHIFPQMSEEMKNVPQSKKRTIIVVKTISHAHTLVRM